MKKQTKLLIKIQRLLKQLNQREYLHDFGPKKFKLIHHLFALLMKEVLKCSFRRCENILQMFGVVTPTYSALCKSRKKIPFWIWKKMLKLTYEGYNYFVAIDSTGFSMTNPSYHYVKRIATKKPIKNYVKLSAFFDLASKKFIALRVRMKKRHDIKDVNYLLKISSPEGKLWGDSSYDAESLHEKCFELKIQTMIKPRKNVKKGFYRRKQMKNYDQEEYPQRNGIEGGFGSVKRKYGGSVSGKVWESVRSELYLKVIAHNLNLRK
jgi:transposase